MGDDVSRENWDLDFEALAGDASLHEVEMRYPDTTIMRLTDRVPQVGETIACRGLLWDVVRVERDPDSVRATARFLCELTQGQRAASERRPVFRNDP